MLNGLATWVTLVGAGDLIQWGIILALFLMLLGVGGYVVDRTEPR